jgi:hypothetical protein
MLIGVKALFTLPEHLSSSPVFSGVRVAQSLALCVCFVARFLSFFFWPLCCLFFFNLLILITPLVSSDSSYCHHFTASVVVCHHLSISHFNLFQISTIYEKIIYKFIFLSITLASQYHFSRCKGINCLKTYNFRIKPGMCFRCQK